MATERLVNFPADVSPTGADIVYVGDSTDSFNEVKVTINALTAASTTVLKVANNLSDLASASAARTNLGLGTAATHAATDFLLVANNLSDLNNAATARTNLGLGTAATHAATDFLLVANNLSDLASASTARTNLGLGTAAVKAASGAGGVVASVTGAFSVGHFATFADTSGTIQDGGASTQFLLAANNLSDVANAGTSRTNLGLGTAAVKAASDNTKSTVAMISGSITTGHYAQFSDTSGTLQDGGSAPAGVLLASNNLSDVISASTSRTNLGLGTAAVKTASDNTKTVVSMISGSITSGHYAVFADTSGTIQDGGATPAGVLLAVNNLSDVANAGTSRTNLGLGTAAVQNIAFFAQVANNLSDLANAATARTNLGLGTAAVKTASASGETVVASVTGSFTTNHLAVFADTAGTIKDGGVAPSGTVNSGTANQLAYYASSSAAVSGLTGANYGMFSTSSSGVPSVRAVPSFSVSLSGNQTLAANGPTKLSLDTAEYNIGSCFDLVTNFRFTPTTSGIYHFDCQCWVGGGNIVAASQYNVVLYKNGTGNKYGNFGQGLTASEAASLCSVDISMNGSTDYVEFYFINSNGVTTITALGGSSLLTYATGHWVAPNT